MNDRQAPEGFLCISDAVNRLAESPGHLFQAAAFPEAFPSCVSGKPERRARVRLPQRVLSCSCVAVLFQRRFGTGKRATSTSGIVTRRISELHPLRCASVKAVAR
jgi:hypothetical protein